MSIQTHQFQEMLTRVERNSGRLQQPDQTREGVSREVEELHKPILKWLNEQVPMIPYWYHRPDTPTGMPAGTPDFGILLRGRLIIVECKTATGKLSIDQLAWKMMAEHQGFTVNIVRTFEEFLSLVT